MHNLDPREDKLPKWAQDKLQMLRSRITDLTQQTDLKRGRPTSVGVNEYFDGADCYLPNDAKITIHIGEERIEFYRATKGDKVCVNASRALCITPQAANVAFLEVRDW